MEIDTILLKDLPLSHSVNEGVAVFRGRILKSKISRQFDKNVEMWILKNTTFLHQVNSVLLKWIEEGYVLRVDCFFIFKKERIFSKHGKVLRIDANNRLKPTLDAVANCVKIDDKYFFSGNAEKVYSEEGAECTTVRISKTKPFTKSQLMDRLKNKAF